MMIQTLAIIQDAYRELQSRKMFWIILLINVIGILAFALLGVTDHAVTFVGKDWHVYPFPGISRLEYKRIFSNLVVGFWFTWLASLLALISTASIFPDFLSSGSIDLYLARPISRLRLFLTKYLAGLLFVALQISVFTILSFFVLGIRGGLWEPGLFLAIPLVLLFFSYLYGAMVLLGTVTRSTIASLLLTLLLWFVIFGADFLDASVSSARQDSAVEMALIDDATDANNAKIDALKKDPEKTKELAQAQQNNEFLENRRKRAEIPDFLLSVQKIAVVVKTPLPKTRETMSVLDQAIFHDKEMQEALRPIKQAIATQGLDLDHPTPRLKTALDEAKKISEENSLFWIYSTSILFELVCMALAAWHFCTRDF